VIGETREKETYEVLQEAKRSLNEDGKLLAKVYNEPSIFDLEVKRIFSKTWIFLAHESEIPWSGDYVLRRIVDDSFIVTRDEVCNCAARTRATPATFAAPITGTPTRTPES
jgi:hypothetical protein